jgi:tetratricopeptide (TPR) repeat protein
MHLRFRPFFLLSIPLFLYAIAVLLLGEWIIDDAGISYAYARNFSEGYGLVSQPGRVPVEGYSNFLWVMLLVPFFKLGIFHPIYLPKLLGLLAWVLVLAILQIHTLQLTKNPLFTVLGFTCMLLAPPLVIWTTSGLENPLSLLLVVLLFHHLVARPANWREKSGLLAALLAMNHPELVLFAAPGMLVAMWAGNTGEPRGKISLAAVMRFFVPWFAAFSSFMIFRYAMFSQWLPHTFYAKRVNIGLWASFYGMLERPQFLLERFFDATRAAFGNSGPYLLGFNLLALLYLWRQHKMPRAIAVALLLQGTGFVTFFVLDVDWMGEYRFATIFITFSLLVLIFMFAWAETALPKLQRARLPALLMALASVMLIAHYIPRFIEFAKRPPVPLAAIKRNKSDKYDAYKEVLGLSHASVMTFDLGAVLYYGRLKVYDLAGLCEPKVVETLKKDTAYWLFDHPEFFDYLFNEIKPTLIEVNGWFAKIASLNNDVRIERDYTAIDSYNDYYHPEVIAGVFVRKDALSKPGQLEQLRRAYRPAPAALPLMLRLSELWLSLQNPERESIDAGELMTKAMYFYRKEKNSFLAEKYYRKVLDVAPSHYGAKYHLAALLDHLGRSFEARPFWLEVEAHAQEYKDTRIIQDVSKRLCCA